MTFFFRSKQKPVHVGVLQLASYDGSASINRTDCDCLEHLASVVNKSSRTNEAVLYNQQPNGDTTWKWRDWKGFLSQHFKPLKGIRYVFIINL